MKIFVDLEKLDEITDLVETFKDEQVRVREVASVLGKLLNLNKGLSVNISCFLTATAQHVLKTAAVGSEWEDWDRWTIVPIKVIVEIEKVLKMIPDWSGKDMLSPVKAVTFAQHNYFAAVEDGMFFCGDAGSDGSVVYNMKEKNRFKVIFFSLSDRSLSSSLRELMAKLPLCISFALANTSLADF